MARVALVIGNSEYDPGRLPQAVNDAALITQKLLWLGYKIFGGASTSAHMTGRSEGENLTANAMRALIDEFVKAAPASATAVMYYAGHALQIDKKNYFLPVDVGIGSDDPIGKLIDIRDVMTRLAKRLGDDGSVAVFLDACHNNPFHRGGGDGQPL
jgi:uncharacterized caspase-like protein